VLEELGVRYHLRSSSKAFTSAGTNCLFVCSFEEERRVKRIE
jgi:hypothetical protein